MAVFAGAVGSRTYQLVSDDRVILGFEVPLFAKQVEARLGEVTIEADLARHLDALATGLREAASEIHRTIAP